MPQTLERLLEHVDSADVDEPLKPYCAVCASPQMEPSGTTETDAQLVLAAGWGKAALQWAVLTVCRFNFTGRLLEGHGVKGNPGVVWSRGQALRDQGYEALLAFFDAATSPSLHAELALSFI